MSDHVMYRVTWALPPGVRDGPRSARSPVLTQEAVWIDTGLSTRFFRYRSVEDANASGWYHTPLEAWRATMEYYDLEAKEARRRADLCEAELVSLGASKT